MSKLVIKIKGLLGFCQCVNCWHRSVAEMEIKATNKKLNVCEEHMNHIINDSVLKEIIVELEEE